MGPELMKVGRLLPLYPHEEVPEALLQALEGFL